MLALPPPLFLGYTAKLIHPVSPTGWGGAEEICSVSTCIANYPQGWDDAPFDPPTFNRAYCQNSVEAARRRVRESLRASSRIYALRMIPGVFVKDSPEPLLLCPEEPFAAHGDLPELPAAPNLNRWERLGFDVTIVGSPDEPMWGWSCSPLSCNYMFQEHPVNRYCLVDDLADAVHTAQTFARVEPEPGPYVIVEVWRERT